MMRSPVLSTDARVRPPKRADSSRSLRLLSFELSSLSEELRAPLEEYDVHTWHANSKTCPFQSHELIRLLSKDELDRMARFHFEQDRQDFAFARGMLRTLLGRYLAIAPEALRFSYAEHGKPSLAMPRLEPDLQFNLSHTSGFVLVAICRGRQIGVDIEKLRSDIDVDDVAARFFSASERQALMSFPEAIRREAFFHCWTRKEALLKARGDGLFFPLGLFDVSIDAGDRVVTLVTRPDPAEAQQWRILRVNAPEGYAAAVAVASPSLEVTTGVGTVLG